MTGIQRAFNTELSRLLNVIRPVSNTTTTKKQNPIKIGIALSGGVDSISLTHLLYRSNLPIQLYPITLNHNYRPESHEESRKVTQLLPMEVRRNHKIIDLYKEDFVSSGTTGGGGGAVVSHIQQIANFEKLARIVRYKKLYESCVNNGINILMTGHTRDDQIETFIQRLFQNSTIFGLASMSPIMSLLLPQYNNHSIQIVRPLLGFDKEQLYDYCKQNRYQWFEDYTNKDTSMTRRNMIRGQLTEMDHDSKQQIVSLISSIQEYHRLLNTKILALYNDYKTKGKLQIDTEFQIISVTLPIKEVEKSENDILFGRFLWYLAGQISPLANYHYTFSEKVIDELHSALLAVVAVAHGGTAQLEKNSLGCRWKFRHLVQSNEIELIIQREIPRINMAHTQNLNTDPTTITQFDNRFSVHCDDPTTFNESGYALKIFNKKDFIALKRFTVLNPQALDKDINSSSLLGLPVIINKGGEIINFPTIKKCDELITNTPFKLEIKLNENKYIHRLPYLYV